MKIKEVLVLSVLTAALTGVGSAWGQSPSLSIVLDEKAGNDGRLSSIAVDTLNQPHIMSDNGGTIVYMYDKVGGTWRSTSLNVGSSGYRQFSNPALEIDRNNRAWCSGIIVVPSGLGFVGQRQLVAGSQRARLRRWIQLSRQLGPSHL